MSSVRVLVGTRKGAFVLESDGKRQEWTINGPHFAGWEIYHLKASPADPNRIYASQSSSWFGQIVQRSDDGGRTWNPVGNRFVYDGTPGTHQWYDGTPHPWEFARVWHFEPSLHDPDTRLRRCRRCRALSLDRRRAKLGRAWQGCARTRRPIRGNRAPAACACTRSSSIRAIPDRIICAISAAGAFRSDDAGATWRPINRGLKSAGIPEQEAEVGHCVHRIAMHSAHPNVLFMQKHWDVMRSDDAGEFVARS